MEQRERARQLISEEVKRLLNMTSNSDSSVDEVNSNCGPGLWHKVARLNMTNSSHNCPAPWIEDSTNGAQFRACKRSNNVRGCDSVFFSTNRRRYNKVCGRAEGYQNRSTVGFLRSFHNHLTIDQGYITGVSVTHGRPPRSHIWTFMSGLNRLGGCSPTSCACPCMDPDYADNSPVPSYIGSHYFCESTQPGTLAGPLWDGMQCGGQCCTIPNTAPWFKVQLNATTTDAIETRICRERYDRSSVTALLSQLEIYIQ